MDVCVSLLDIYQTKLKWVFYGKDRLVSFNFGLTVNLSKVVSSLAPIAAVMLFLQRRS